MGLITPEQAKAFDSGKKISEITPTTTPGSGSQTPSPKELSLWDRKYANDATKFTDNPILLKLLNGEWNNQSYDDLYNSLNAKYQKEFKIDYKLLKDAETRYLNDTNKAVLRNSIKHIDEVRFKEYEPLKKYSSSLEYVYYGLFFILLFAVFQFFITKLIKRISIQPKDSNTGTLGESDDSRPFQPKTFYLKKSTLQALLTCVLMGFLVVSLLQLFQLADIKEMFYDLNLSYNVISINNIGYPETFNKLRSSTTFFGNDIELPIDLYNIENSWKGIFSNDFFEFKFKMVLLLINNTLKDAFYWIVIALSMFSLVSIQKWLKRNVRIRIN